MKKFALAFSALLLIMASCSKSDSDDVKDQSILTGDVLIKKMILTSTTEDLDSFWNATYTYSYNGSKLTQITGNDGYKAVYTYTGDLITKIDYFYGIELEGKDIFIYNSSGKLISYKDQDILQNFERIYNYTYLSNGSVTYNISIGQIGSACCPSSSQTYVFSNGELTADSNGPLVYDNKNNPFKNITGYKEIIFPEVADDYQIAFGRNKNLTSVSLTSNPIKGTFSTYTYNANDYPITSITNANYDGFTGTVNAQYFYE
jgi:hypothetical protein